MPKTSGYVKTFKVKDGDKDKNNKLMSFRIDDENLFENIKLFRLKNIELNDIPVSDGRYIKTKIRTYGDKVYTNFHGLNVSEDVRSVNLLQSFLLILYWYTKPNITCKYLDICAYKTASKQMKDYLGDNFFEDLIL